jgi:hypothetical protein
MITNLAKDLPAMLAFLHKAPEVLPGYEVTKMNAVIHEEQPELKRKTIDPMPEAPALTPQEYYRLPWTLNDNGISWLEVTDACNLTCEGCYRPHHDNHKSLEDIAKELAVFKAARNSDCMSLAGGDPLVHPEIVEIVRMVREGGWKPIINTNGLALGPKLLAKLKEAGASGFTFHIDTTQIRKDSEAETEADHNALRTKFAKMVAAEGGLTCSFNQTVSVTTLDQVKETMEWALKYPDIVHTVVFILFRSPSLAGDFDFYANGEQITSYDNYEESAWGGDSLLEARHVVAKIREVDPDFEPSAYLGGTVDPNSTKWTVAMRMASKEKGLGYVSPKYMEYLQTGHHLFKGTWLSYSHPKLLQRGRSTTALFSLFDRGMRKIGKRYLGALGNHELSIKDKLHMQAFTIIQPVDMMPDGRTDMCDGCPDMTVHDGQLYWSCRLEEIKSYGCFAHAVPQGCQKPIQPTLSD